MDANKIIEELDAILGRPEELRMLLDRINRDVERLEDATSRNGLNAELEYKREQQRVIEQLIGIRESINEIEGRAESGTINTPEDIDDYLNRLESANAEIKNMNFEETLASIQETLKQLKASINEWDKNHGKQIEHKSVIWRLKEDYGIYRNVEDLEEYVMNNETYYKDNRDRIFRLDENTGICVYDEEKTIDYMLQNGGTVVEPEAKADQQPRIPRELMEHAMERRVSDLETNEPVQADDEQVQKSEPKYDWMKISAIRDTSQFRYVNILEDDILNCIRADDGFIYTMDTLGNLTSSHTLTAQYNDMGDDEKEEVLGDFYNDDHGKEETGNTHNHDDEYEEALEVENVEEVDNDSYIFDEEDELGDEEDEEAIEGENVEEEVGNDSYVFDEEDELGDEEDEEAIEGENVEEEVGNDSYVFDDEDDNSYTLDEEDEEALEGEYETKDEQESSEQHEDPQMPRYHGLSINDLKGFTLLNKQDIYGYYVLADDNNIYVVDHYDGSLFFDSAETNLFNSMNPDQKQNIINHIHGAEVYDAFTNHENEREGKKGFFDTKNKGDVHGIYRDNLMYYIDENGRLYRPFRTDGKTVLYWDYDETKKYRNEKDKADRLEREESRRSSRRDNNKRSKALTIVNSLPETIPLRKKAIRKMQHIMRRHPFTAIKGALGDLLQRNRLTRRLGEKWSYAADSREEGIIGRLFAKEIRIGQKLQAKGADDRLEYYDNPYFDEEYQVSLLYVSDIEKEGFRLEDQVYYDLFEAIEDDLEEGISEDDTLPVEDVPMGDGADRQESTGRAGHREFEGRMNPESGEFTQDTTVQPSSIDQGRNYGEQQPLETLDPNAGVQPITRHGGDGNR